MICANADLTLDDWLEYDWIGPSSWGNQYGTRNSSGLRRLSRIHELFSFQERTNDTDSENMFIAEHLFSMPGSNFASPEATAAFAIEQIWSSEPMGYHLAISKDVWASVADRVDIYQHCPEIKMVLSPMKLQKETCSGKNANRDPANLP